MFGKLCDPLSEFAKAADTVVDAKGFKVVVAGDEHTRRVGVGDLDVEPLLAPGLVERLLDERGLADASTPRHLHEEPAPALEDCAQVCKFALSTVEAPGLHG